MQDSQIIEAAFDAVSRLESLFDDAIPWGAIEQGFSVGGEKIHFANKARGIFKPAQLERGVLSIKTVVPRAGRINIYSDHHADDEYFHYSLQAGDPTGGGNKYLWQAKELAQPFIYFYGVYPGFYTAIWPCYAAQIHDLGPDQSFADIYVGMPKARSPLPELVSGRYALPDTFERRYAVRESRARLHQSSFRQSVLAAYENKCAMTGLPTARLLDAAHITPDSYAHGEATVRNGIALSKLHHGAYDKNLVGINADFRVHVSSKMLNSKDGPLLEFGIKKLHGERIALPRSRDSHPDKERLAERFEHFLASEKD